MDAELAWNDLRTTQALVMPCWTFDGQVFMQMMPQISFFEGLACCSRSVRITLHNMLRPSVCSVRKKQVRPWNQVGSYWRSAPEIVFAAASRGKKATFWALTCA